MDYSWNINVTSWNVGEDFDYRNVLLRSGANCSDQHIQNIHSQVKKAYDNEGAKLEEKKRFNPDMVFSHRDLPRCRVSTEEANIIGDARIEKIQSVCRFIAANSDLVLLQEIMPDEIPLLLAAMPRFEACVGKDIEPGKGECFDTVVLWNQKRFKRLESSGNETSKRRTTTALLRDVTTDKVIQVASLHARGFNIVNPSDRLADDKTLEGDQEVVEMILRGDVFFHKPDVKIFGGDFNSEFSQNATSEISERNHFLSQRRFKLLEEKGFNHIDITVPTCFNSAIAQLPNRKDGLCILDHLFVSSIDNSKINGIHRDGMHLPLEDISKNPSDHRPVFFSVYGNN